MLGFLTYQSEAVHVRLPPHDSEAVGRKLHIKKRRHIRAERCVGLRLKQQNQQNLVGPEQRSEDWVLQMTNSISPIMRQERLMMQRLKAQTAANSK
jgi:hypothetical protein